MRLGLLILFAGVAAATAELVPADRRIEWVPGVTVGVPGGIPTYRTNLIDVTQSPYNADNTGATDCEAAIESAIAAAASNDVVYLPAGTYKVLAPITTKSFITIRGAGIGVTTINFTSTWGAVFAIGADSDYNWDYPPDASNNITSGYTKGSSNLVFSSNLAVSNQLCFLIESNNISQPVVHVSGYGNLRQQMVRITRVDNGTNITIWPPLYWTMTAGLNPQWIMAQYTITRFSGIEEMTINASGSTSPTAILNFLECYGSWAKNVKTVLGKNYMFNFNACVQCEMRGCWADRSTDGPVSNHGGILLGSTSASLFENNIVDDIFPAIEVNFASAGNVFAYNFINGTYWGGYINGNHGPHNSFNLYEGNVSPNFQSDGYFGSASEDTLYRNWFTTQIPHSTETNGNIGIWSVKLNRFNRNATMVGNVLGSPRTNRTVFGVMELGHPNIGNDDWSGYAPPWADTLGGSAGPSGFQEMDTNVYASAILKTNYILASGTPESPANQWPTNLTQTSLGSDTLSNSLFRTEKPSSFGSLAWPPFSPTTATAVSATNIPAGYLYVYGTNPPAEGGGGSAGTYTVNIGTLRMVKP